MTGVRWWIWVAVVLCVFLMVVAFAAYVLGEGSDWLQVEMTEFFVYEDPNSLSKFPRIAVETVYSNVDALYACGRLRAAGRVSLGFLLFRDEKPLGWFVLEKHYEPGYICERLPPSWQQAGSYRVEVWLPRHKIGSVEFVVVEP